MGTPRATRPCAFVFIREGDSVLLARMTDPSGGAVFYRPLGGGIGFQERAADAARREIREELGRELSDPRLLGVVENIFEYHAEPWHEICFVFDASPEGWSLADADGVEVVPEAEGRETAVVVGLDELRRLDPLYPDGVAEILPY